MLTAEVPEEVVTVTSTAVAAYAGGDCTDIELGDRTTQPIAETPQNFTEVTPVKFVPENAYGQQQNGETVFTHGVELGVARASSRDLVESTDALLGALAQGNPSLREAAQPRQTRLSQRTAIEHQLVNRSHDGGQERVGLITTFLADGNLFYLLTIAPSDEIGRYQPAFSRVAGNLRLNDR